MHWQQLHSELLVYLFNFGTGLSNSKGYTRYPQNLAGYKKFVFACIFACKMWIFAWELRRDQNTLSNALGKLISEGTTLGPKPPESDALGAAILEKVWHLRGYTLWAKMFYGVTAFIWAFDRSIRPITSGARSKGSFGVPKRCRRPYWKK